MAKKKLSSMDDAVKLFKDVMQRASLESYHHVNRIMLSKNEEGNRILVIPEQGLWDTLIGSLEIKELDISIPEQSDEVKWFEYGEDLENNWFPIDMGEDLFNGKIFKVLVKGHEYHIPINKELMPMKLKKAEYDNLSYRIFNKPLLILAIKKRFEPIVPDSGFTIIRLFQVI